MNDQQLAFYFDESVQVAIAKQLKRHGIDAVTARDLEKLGDVDPNPFAARDWSKPRSSHL